MLGFWSELDKEDKVKAGVLFLVLSAAGFMLYRNWGDITGHTPDTTVSGWVEDHNVPLDPTKPLSVTNVSPNSYRSIFFADADGQIELRQFPWDKNRQDELDIVPKAELRRGKAAARANPYDETANTFSEPDKRMLALALLQRPGHRPWALRTVELTSQQAQQEKTALDTLEGEASLLATEQSTGTFQMDLLKKIKTQLAAFQANGDDLQKSSAKQQQARDLIALCQQYANGSKEAEKKMLTAYVNAVHDLLNDDQRSALGQRFEQLAERYGHRKPNAG